MSVAVAATYLYVCVLRSHAYCFFSEYCKVSDHPCVLNLCCSFIDQTKMQVLGTTTQHMTVVCWIKIMDHSLECTIEHSFVVLSKEQTLHHMAELMGET